jgi:hypothetical protein
MIMLVRIAAGPSPGDVVARRYKDADSGQPYWIIRVEGSDLLPDLSIRPRRDEVVRLVREQSQRENRRGLVQNAVGEFEVVFGG